MDAFFFLLLFYSHKDYNYEKHLNKRKDRLQNYTHIDIIMIIPMLKIYIYVGIKDQNIKHWLEDENMGAYFLLLCFPNSF